MGIIAYRIGLTALNRSNLPLLYIEPAFQIAKDCEHTSASYYIGCIHDILYRPPNRFESGNTLIDRSDNELRNANYITATLSSNNDIKSLAYFRLGETYNIKKDYDAAALYYIEAIDSGKGRGIKELTDMIIDKKILENSSLNFYILKDYITSELEEFDISKKERDDIIKKLDKAQSKLGDKTELDKYFKTAYHKNANKEFIDKQDEIFTKSGTKDRLLGIPPAKPNSSEVLVLNNNLNTTYQSFKSVNNSFSNNEQVKTLNEIQECNGNLINEDSTRKYLSDLNNSFTQSLNDESWCISESEESIGFGDL